MQVQDLIVTCIYPEDGVSISQIIQGSFVVFLQKELENTLAMTYKIYDEWSLISGGRLCT